MRVCDSKIDLLNIENHEKKNVSETLRTVPLRVLQVIATETNRSRCTHAIRILGAGTISIWGDGFSLNDMSHECR